MKVSIIGAGSVGATLAQRVLESGMADVVMVDIAGDVARGKALDLSDAAPVIGHERAITGTDDYALIKDSAAVVITAGFPRKPGMSREDLIAKNAAIVKDVSQKIKTYSPQAIVIVVTNPLDAMTYIAYRTTGFGRERVFGMAGILDSSRFTYLLSDELKVPRSAVKTLMLGSHGDTMVPVISRTTVSGKPVRDLLPKAKLDAVIKRTCGRGAEIVSLLGSGSAYYSPSAGVYRMLDVIFGGKSQALVVSAYLDGEYGLSGICIGVPCVLGKKGIEKIIEIDLSGEEAAAFKRSAAAIKDTIDLL
jgi:malate dehydrogenase